MQSKAILVRVCLLLVIVTGYLYWRFTDQIHNLVNPVTQVTFQPSSIPWTRMSFGDHNNDGYIETIGTTNDGSGVLVPIPRLPVVVSRINSVGVTD